MRYWLNPLVNILHFGPNIQGSSGNVPPPTGTTGYLKRPGYVIGTLPIQTPNLPRKIFGTSGAPIPPIPPTPVADHTGFGGGGWIDPKLIRQWEKRRRKKFDDECEERAELAKELRAALAEPEVQELPIVSESTAVRLNIDPKIAGLLARAEDAPLNEFRALVEKVLAEVEATIRDEDDTECLLLVM